MHYLGSELVRAENGPLKRFAYLLPPSLTQMNNSAYVPEAAHAIGHDIPERQHVHFSEGGTLACPQPNSRRTRSSVKTLPEPDQISIRAKEKMNT